MLNLIASKSAKSAGSDILARTYFFFSYFLISLSLLFSPSLLPSWCAQRAPFRSSSSSAPAQRTKCSRAPTQRIWTRRLLWSEREKAMWGRKATEWKGAKRRSRIETVVCVFFFCSTRTAKKEDIDTEYFSLLPNKLDANTHPILTASSLPYRGHVYRSRQAIVSCRRWRAASPAAQWSSSTRPRSSSRSEARRKPERKEEFREKEKKWVKREDRDENFQRSRMKNKVWR